MKKQQNNNIQIKNPLISFILPNYNNEHVLNLFFEKFLENNTYKNYEFIVVDDGSEDNSLEILKWWQISGKINNMIIIAEPHKGIINALNKALYQAKGDFIIRCDGDATLESRSPVEKFLEFYNISPEKIGVITSKVYSDISDKPIHALGRSIISSQGLLDRGFEPNEDIGKRTWDYYSKPIENLDNIIDEPAECDMALGVFTFCDRKTALEIGGFDKNFPLWIEDDDFYLSFRKYGKKCFYLPTIEICHRWSLRGNRNPGSWLKKKNKISWLFSKKVKETKTIYKILGIPVLKIKEKNLRKKYYILGIKIWSKKYLGWRPEILSHDYRYWKQKWGFDCLNPNINEIKEKYKGTELLWKYDDSMKKQGEEIIKKYKDTCLTNKTPEERKNKQIIFIGEGCWFVDSFIYFLLKGIHIKVIKSDVILWKDNIKIWKDIGAEVIEFKDNDSFYTELNLNKNTIIIGGGNFSGKVSSLMNENLYNKSHLELEILKKISKYNKEHKCNAKTIRYFNGDTGFGNNDEIKKFNDALTYVDTLMFDNDNLYDFVSANINIQNKKILFGWLETPLSIYVENNNSKEYKKIFLSLGRNICSSKYLKEDLNIVSYPKNKKSKLVLKDTKDRYALAGLSTFSSILLDRKDFYNKHKSICFGLSHFYDVFQGGIDVFKNNKDYFYSIEGQYKKMHNASKEIYYAFVNNVNKDICYMMNGIIPLISHSEHNIYKEMIDKKMAILIKDPDDIQAVLKMSDEEIQRYRDNIYINRDLFTFDRVGKMLINLLDDANY